MVLKKIKENSLVIILIVSAIVWILATIVDSVMVQDKMSQSKNFLDLLIFDIPDMLLFHRILFILIGLFITSMFLLNKAHKRVKVSEQKLKIANDTKNKFFAILSHDYKSPFTGFLNLTQYLIDSKDKLKPDEILEVGESMNKTAKKMYGFMENLLIWSTSQMNQMPIKIDEIKVYFKISEIISLFEEILKEKDIRLLIKIEKDIKVMCDIFMFNSIFRNLIYNAIKYTAKGGNITVSANKGINSNVDISVIDDGIGMKEEKIKNLFRIDIKTSTPGTAMEQGSGLGLILIKEFLEKNNGNIRIESEFGNGSNFTVSLPTIKKL